MALSQAAKEYRNKRRRERYANDPAFREREKKRIEAYWERKAAEAAALNDEGGQQDDDNMQPAADSLSIREGATI